MRKKISLTHTHKNQQTNQPTKEKYPKQNQINETNKKKPNQTKQNQQQQRKKKEKKRKKKLGIVFANYYNNLALNLLNIMNAI